MEVWYVGSIAGCLAALFLALFAKSVLCPECGKPQPTFRWPANLGQLLWGGWTCKKCGCEIDRRGHRK